MAPCLTPCVADRQYQSRNKQPQLLVGLVLAVSALLLTILKGAALAADQIANPCVDAQADACADYQ